MDHDEKDKGVILALLQRFNRQRLPKLLALKERVDAGEVLNDSDIHFLSEVMTDFRASEQYVQRNPEYKELVASVLHLYKEIMDKALDNEKRT